MKISRPKKVSGNIRQVMKLGRPQRPAMAAAMRKAGKSMRKMGRGR